MRISAISPNYVTRNNNYKKQVKTSQPVFTSNQRDEDYDAGLRYLNSKMTKVYQGFNIGKLSSEINEMVLKYWPLGLNGVGLMQVHNEDLPVLLGKTAQKCDLKEKIGLCLVMGEPVGEVADMDEIYEVRLFIDTPENINKVFQNAQHSNLH